MYTKSNSSHHFFVRKDNVFQRKMILSIYVTCKSCGWSYDGIKRTTGLISFKFISSTWIWLSLDTFPMLEKNSIERKIPLEQNCKQKITYCSSISFSSLLFCSFFSLLSLCSSHCLVHSRCSPYEYFL